LTSHSQGKCENSFFALKEITSQTQLNVWEKNRSKASMAPTWSMMMHRRANRIVDSMSNIVLWVVMMQFRSFDLLQNALTSHPKSFSAKIPIDYNFIAGIFLFGRLK
jgi:hypothetical protein